MVKLTHIARCSYSVLSNVPADFSVSLNNMPPVVELAGLIDLGMSAK